jgi:hypothetical protein
MNATPSIRFTFRRGRLWFEVAGVVCVATYPQAIQLLQEIT